MRTALSGRDGVRSVDISPARNKKTIVNDIVFFFREPCRLGAFNPEIDMIKPPTILTRLSAFRAGVGVAVVATAMPALTPASASAEGASQAGAEPLNGDGFYRFKIGDFQATVVSDGYGPNRSGRSSP